MVTLPAPVPGLVFRYDYLWLREQKAGRTTSKDRPVCTIVAHYRAETGDTVLLLAAITHTAPGGDDVGLEVPAAEKRRLGLDDLPSWLVLTELNRDVWPNGLSPVPGSGAGAYGILSGPLMLRAAQMVRDLAAGKRLRIVLRE